MLRRSLFVTLPAFAWLTTAGRSARGVPARKPVLLQTSPFSRLAGFQYHISGVAVLALRSDRRPETPVKVFAAEPFPFEDEYRRSLVKPLHGSIAVRFVCIETLICMKEASDRLADRADAEQLRLTLKIDEPLDLQPGEIDWRLTTWEGSRREQLRYWATLPLERAVEGLEGMEELFERFRETRNRREFHTGGSGSSPVSEAFGPRVDRPQ